MMLDGNSFRDNSERRGPAEMTAFSALLRLSANGLGHGGTNTVLESLKRHGEEAGKKRKGSLEGLLLNQQQQMHAQSFLENDNVHGNKLHETNNGHFKRMKHHHSLLKDQLVLKPTTASSSSSSTIPNLHFALQNGNLLFDSLSNTSPPPPPPPPPTSSSVPNNRTIMQPQHRYERSSSVASYEPEENNSNNSNQLPGHFLRRADSSGGSSLSTSPRTNQSIFGAATISTRKRCNDCKTCNHKACGRCTNCLHKKKRKRSCENRLPCMDQLVLFAQSVFDQSSQAIIISALHNLPENAPLRAQTSAVPVDIIETRQRILKEKRKALMAEDKALELLKKAFV